MRHLRRRAIRRPKGRVRVNRLANIHHVCTPLDRRRNLADHVAGMGADHASAQNLAVAMGFG